MVEERCEISHGQTSESGGVPGRRGTEKGGAEEGEKTAAKEGRKSPKQRAEAFFYEGIVKCALSFPFAGGNKGPHSI